MYKQTHNFSCDPKINLFFKFLIKNATPLKSAIVEKQKLDLLKIAGQYAYLLTLELNSVRTCF